MDPGILSIPGFLGTSTERSVEVSLSSGSGTEGGGGLDGLWEGNAWICITREEC